LKAIGYDEKEAKENFDKNSTRVEKHELPTRVNAINSLGGGKDFSGQGNDTYGGFARPVGT
jgi:hypothetical protein